jgi:uncharacterized transporter YbjL
MNKIYALLSLLLFAVTAVGQEGSPEMADRMRQDGKIYVVVLVLSVVFVCLATYLVWIDRKLKKLEEKK